MVKLSSSGEIGQFISVTQFDGGSLGKCGFYAAATVALSAAIGASPQAPGAIVTAGDRTYIQFDGQDAATNPAGMTQSTLHEVLSTYSIDGSDISTDWSTIKARLNNGYPVIVCVPESQVVDVQVGNSPYPWDTTGYNHIILLTGIAPDGNVLVRDSANITAPNNVRPGPRTYAISVLTTIYWATAVTPVWHSTTTTQEEDVQTVIELNTPGVSQFWAPSANGAWRCTAPGHDHLMLGNIRSFYVRFGNQGLNGVTYLGLPITDMFSPKTGTYAQAFERGVVVDDTNRVIDHAVGLPATEHCYLAHLDSGFGQTLLAQPVATPLQNQIKSLAAQLADVQKSGGDPAQLAALETQIKTLQDGNTLLLGRASASEAKITQAVAVLSK